MVPHARPAAYHTVLIVQRIWRDEVKVLITYLRTEALAQVSSEFRSVVELVQVEVTRFTLLSLLFLRMHPKGYFTKR